MMSAHHRGIRLVLPFLGFLLASAIPAAAQQEARGSLRCESNGSYLRCPASGTWRGARLVQQLSNKPCLQGRTWGFDRNAIWVNEGCRGVFDAGDPYANAGERVTCASAGARTECPADTRFGVKLIRQLSQVGCVEGRTWGTQEGGLWVDRGCRGEFEIGGQTGGVPETGERMTCGTPTGLQVTCRTNGYATAVQLVRDLSSGRCREGDTWGFTDSFIWTNRACRGEFMVTYRDGPGDVKPPVAGGTVAQRVTCGGSSGQRVTCAVDRGITLARLLRDLSGGRCRQNVSWGYGPTSLWINNGCVGEFELAVRSGPGGGGGTLTRELVCGAATGQQMTCQTNGYATSVRLIADLSGGRCRERVNWGFTDSYVWANQGCRARFLVTYSGSGRQ
jgi:hypothetical protein